MKQNKKQNYGQEKSGSRFGALLFGLKIRWAGWMRRQSDRLSTRGKWLALTLLCVLATGINVLLVVRSLNPKAAGMLTLSRIRSPRQLNSGSGPKSVLSDQEIKRIQSAEKYLDSLAHSTTGRQQYQRLLQEHPGILDSIQKIEQLYQQQKR